MLIDQRERLQHASQSSYTKTAAASVPFRAADHLRNAKDITGYIQAMLADGDALAVPIALRTVAEAVGAFDLPAARCDANTGTQPHCWLDRAGYSTFAIRASLCQT
jgi:hypothetical protein